MATERTIRTPKRPLAYAIIAAAAAVLVAGAVAATWRIAHSTVEAPMQVGTR